MNSSLHTWLSKHVKFEPVDFHADLSDVVVDLFISDRCNLRCRHCYFGNTHTQGSLLTLQDWKAVIGSLYSEGARHFHVSGRESSLDRRVPEIISYIKHLDGTYTGLVTNGTGELQFYEEIIGAGADYLEFSIDGTEQTHDYIRGSGVFSQVVHTIESLSGYSHIIDISTCLNKHSIDEYLQLVDFCLDLGVRKFFATSFLVRGNGKSFSSAAISATDFSKLIEKSYAYLSSKADGQIALKYCVPHDMTISMIEDGGFFEQLLHDYMMDKSQLTTQINGNVIQVALNILDIPFLNNISITSDGEILSCSDDISDNDYPRIGIGNILGTDISTIIQTRANIINHNLNALQYENRIE